MLAAIPFWPEWLTLLHPGALAALAFVPLLWWLWLKPGRRPVIRFSSLESLKSAGGGASGRPRWILPLLRTIAIVALVVAVARPQKADESSRTFAEGIAIQMVVDTSGSMRDLDLSPPGKPENRLEVVKQVFRRFVLGDGDKLAGRKNDLIGMIRFARFADSVCPLTLDHKSLAAVLDQTQIVQTQEEDGTAIGDGLALAVERMRDLKRVTGGGEQLKITSRVIILLSDGENNFGMVTPEQAGELAANYGIKVYTIMAGTGRNMTLARLPVDDRDLVKIAELTGGRYYQATNHAALIRIYEDIDKLERTKTEERRFVRWGELSRPWMLAALFALALQSLLDSTRLRKIP